MSKVPRKRPAEPSIVCPCCQKERSARTVREHMKKLRIAGKTDGTSIDVYDEPTTLGLGDASLGQDPFNGEIPGLPSVEPLEPPETEPQSAEEPQPPLPLPRTPTPSARRFPPVTVTDWPDPEDISFDPEFDGLRIPEEDAFRDPEDLYACAHDEEDDSEAAQQFADWSDPEFLDFMRRELGDSVDEDIQSIFKQAITTEDKNVIRLLSAKLRAHFSSQTYEDIRWSFTEEIGLPSEYIAWRRIQRLAGIKSRLYDCCVASCCAFLGRFKQLSVCPYCKEARFDSKGKPRKYFRYVPLIPQLQALFQNLSLIDQLRYRSHFKHTKGIMTDIFDGAHYRSLRKEKLNPDHPYHFFDDPHDIALGLSLDGFSLFKRRRQGNSTAWPLILVNYSLSPTIRTHLENIICVGVIPGPKQFKDLNSFLVPLLEELLELEAGVETIDCSASAFNRVFTLRAFLLLAFGDIPALTKLLGIKGHNALSPCRTCDITGVKDDQPNSHVYYVPLTTPEGDYWNPANLQIRSSASFETRLAEMEATTTKTARENLARTYGINSRCILSSLRAINMATSFPYDFMHLIYENLVPNLIRHWTGTFKHLDEGYEKYQLSADQWEAIGKETAAATATLPAGFVGTLPDIAQDIGLYKAEAYGFWIQYIAPIVLKGRLGDKYYWHLLDLRDIIVMCLQYELTAANIATLEVQITRWVSNYEKYYYQYSAKRVSACPLTVHALLHVPYYIRHSGPVWTSWAFAMERFCGSLLPAVRNRLRPYPCIDNFVQRRAQMQVLTALYGLPTITAPERGKTTVSRGGVLITSWEKVYDEFPASILNRPVHHSYPVDQQLQNQFIKYFGVVLNPRRTPTQLKELIKLDSIVRYGRVRIAGEGDRGRIRTAEGIHSGRNNSFVRYIMFPDANASFRNRADRPVPQVNYGQIEDIFYVELNDHGDPEAPHKFLLARVTPCKISNNRDATEELVEYRDMARQSLIVHLSSIEAVVGRVKRHETWSIVDRSQGAVRTLFTDDNNAPSDGFDS